MQLVEILFITSVKTSLKFLSSAGAVNLKNANKYFSTRRHHYEFNPIRLFILALANSTYDLVTSLLILMAATAEGRLQVIALDEEIDFLLS